MTLKTLNLIHRALEIEVGLARKYYKAARAEADNAGERDQELEDRADRLWKAWSDMSDALHEFESKEW